MLAGASLCCALGHPRAAPAAEIDTISGNWQGSAWFQGSRLDFGVRFQLEDTRLHATFSSPDLMLLDLPLDDVKLSGREVGFTTPDDHPLRFHGVLAGDSVRGTAAVPAVPGVYRPASGARQVSFAIGRASPPMQPPYASREVAIAAGPVRLAATLLIPAAGGADAAGIVLLQGSTSNLRQGSRFLADHFARAGLAVLTFDKRGSGQSSGDYHAASYDELAADAAAAVEWLRRQPEVDPEHVGLWGASQGAFIAPLVATRVPGLRFIVAVSAPGMAIGECAAYQDSMRLAAAGFDAADIRRTLTLDWRLTD